MKNLLRLLLLSLFFVFNSCIVNDTFDDLTTPLEGTWKMTSFKVGTPFDLNGDGTASRDILTETNCYQNETIEFNANFTGLVVSRSYADIEVSIVTGTTDEVSYTVGCVTDLFNQNLVWSKNGNSVTLNIDGVTFIAALSDNRLTFVIPEGFSIESLENGVLVTINQNITFTYTKQ